MQQKKVTCEVYCLHSTANHDGPKTVFRKSWVANDSYAVSGTAAFTVGWRSAFHLQGTDGLRQMFAMFKHVKGWIAPAAIDHLVSRQTENASVLCFWWTCATWSTSVGTDTGGPWQLVSTGLGGHTFRVPLRVRRSERNCSPFECGSSACCLGTITSFRQTVTCPELRRQLQLLIPCGRRVELGNHQGSGGPNDLATSSGVSVVGYEIAHALNQRAGGWEFTSNPSIWPANEGLKRTDGTRRSRFPFERGRRKRPASKTFRHSGIRARGLGKTSRLRSNQKNRFLVIQGQHDPDNAQRFGRTEAPTVPRTAVSVFLQIFCRQWDCVGVSGVWVCRVIV